MDVEYIKKRINKIQFSECESILMGDVLHYSILALSKLCLNKRQVVSFFLKFPFSILKHLVISNYILVGNPQGKSLFLYSSSYGQRDDMERNFLKVFDLSTNGVAAIYKKDNKKLTFYKTKYIKLLINWYKALKNEKIFKKRFEILYVLKSISFVWLEYKDIEILLKNNFKNIENLISWCDVHSVDSFLTQKFNLLHKQTIALMHGSIGGHNNPWSISGIKSDVFIADSSFTKDLLINNSYKGKIYICGYPYNIDYKINKMSNNTKTIGIFMSHVDLINENLELLSTIRILNNPQFTFLAKLHPVDCIKNYPSDYLNVFSEIYTDDITSKSFFEKIDYAIISPSTVVYEAIFNDTPFLFIKDKLMIYKAYGMPTELLVGINDFERKIEEMLSNKNQKTYQSLKKYYAPQGEVRNNYLSTFEELGIND